MSEKGSQKENNEEANTSAPGWVRNIVILQAVIAVLTLLVGKPHTMLHQMNWPFPSPEQVAQFNFIGIAGNTVPSIWSVLLETTAWSFLGVMARTEYKLARMLQHRKPVSIATAMGQIFGDAAAGISIAVALVALLWSSELKVIDIKLTLKDAGIGSIIAVSFVLGFFNDRTQKFLGLIQGKLFGNTDSKGDS
ncbi:MAG TPA: hypothetical protein PKA34_16565 [Blastocatellia bacterium]|nr:hypothetical protein [Blastocatellia bacterium]